MEIGRRLYFNKGTGELILDTGERSGSVVATSIEQDRVTYEINTDELDIVQLEYGEHESDFLNGPPNLIDGQLVFPPPQELPQQ